MDDERWVAFVRGAHRPGTLTALAAVFSTRGVNFESLATAEVDDTTGLIVVTFRATPRRQQELARAVERLTPVHSVLVRRAADLGVRAAGVMHLPRGVTFRPPARAAVAWSGVSEAGEPVLVEGPLVDVELVVAAAREAGATVSGIVIQPPPAP
ncbi:hypothetical protein [Cellulomonas massiliensis]|uniref:hypothetical protein n=1 Tax=Cellulomonas massiliensis TaxID=1465811 RepID=UPI0002EAB811|nr:hypothetical protein [Cellulomonas massiliensis]